MTERPRILFVDDEPQVLDALNASLWRLRKTWSMRFVCGGVAAVDAIRSEVFDIVVSDMRMPVVDGEGVLVAAASHHPGTIRIILSGQTDRAVAIRTTSVAHHFLSKPCKVEELQTCLDEVLAIALPIPAAMREIVCAVGSLAVSSGMLSRLADLVSRPNPDPNEIVSCIEQDFAFTAKLLHCAGAGFFARRQAVTSVRHAISVIGADALRLFVTSLTAREPDAGIERLYDHALLTARVLVHLTDDTHAFLCGVLHGLGKLALLDRFGTSYRELLAEAAATGVHLHRLELARFGVSHDAVAAHLVELWGMPPAIARAIRDHCAPGHDADPLAIALHTACAVANGATRIEERIVSRDGVAALKDWLVSQRSAGAVPAMDITRST